MNFLDQPLSHLGARRTSRDSADLANPFRSFDTLPSHIPSLVWAIVTVAACAGIGLLLAWRG